jgi:ABC-type transporter Mla subunit MlaD
MSLCSSCLTLCELAYSNGIAKMKSLADKEKQRIDRLIQESQDVVQKQDQVKDEIAKINEKGNNVVKRSAQHNEKTTRVFL